MIFVENSQPPKGADAQLLAGTPPTAYYSTAISPGYEHAQTPFERPRESTKRRIAKRHLVALLMGIITLSLVHIANPRLFNWNSAHQDEWPSPMSLPIEPSEDVHDCVQGPQWKPLEGHTAHSGGSWVTAEFKLPLEDEDKFTFLARGARSYGGFHVVESSDVTDVVVNVDAYYYQKRILGQARVCTIGLHGDSHHKGVAIYTPSHWPYPRWGHHEREQLEFYVTVTLPSSKHSIRHIPQFTTSFHNFAQRFDNLTKFDFGRVSLHTSNGPIAIKNIVAESLTAETTNGPITGNYNTTSHLLLHTTNSPIKVGVTASDDGKTDRPTTVNLHTTNAVLQASLSLVANTTEGRGGAFSVQASTTNSPISVATLDAPPDSVLHLTARTTNGHAVVSLHPSYEGTFKASTTNFAPSLNQLPDVEDPTGEGRPRSVEIHSLRGRTLDGSVQWAPSHHEDGKAGSVSVSTTNSPVNITL
ncbi:hypothetical protein FA95DRAFT_1609109 [Auriscalpium vulgare]|uniref:Uncharacterized protein n=1 Tax=Auriscalpium vulgare TaxID=40419 RepID=A0ACB8RI86_9AGAM|nr:hypothetical protein FA95DRAFT_1609109 [Auriscalpium vulgare]